MVRTLLMAALALCLVVVPSGWSEAAVLYAADGAQGNPSHLFIIDPATGGTVSTVGPIGFAVTGLAVHPGTGVLYGSTGNAGAVSPGSLITIDKGTGAGTLVGSFGVPNQTMADIAFASDGTLYGWAEPSADALHRINLATGQATLIGPSGLSTFGSGLAATADAFFFAGRGGGGPLFSVNRTTGATTPITLLDWFSDAGIGALSFAPDGTLFGMGLPNAPGPAAVLLTIEPHGGHVTVIGPTIGFGDALAFDPPTFPSPSTRAVPTLSEIGFGVMAALLMAVALYHVRRRQRIVAG